MKSLKMEIDEDDDDFLEDLVVDTNPEEAKTYLNLKPGGFITKAEDRKGRLEKRQARITMAKECCDMGQNDTIGKIELNPSFILSSDNTNCKNDIQ